MSETNSYAPSDIIQAAKKVGMPDKIPGDVRTPEGKASLTSVLVDSVRNVSERAADKNTHVSRRRQMNIGRRVLAGAALSAATIGGEAVLNNDEAPKPATAEYIVQPGDTAWNMAENIKEKINATPGQEDIGDIRPLVDNIMEQADDDGQPGLQPGEGIQLPEAADRHLDPGIQLSSK
jgi:hypothetical protein